MWKIDNLYFKNCIKIDIFMYFFLEYSIVGKVGFINIVFWVFDLV